MSEEEEVRKKVMEREIEREGVREGEELDRKESGWNRPETSVRVSKDNHDT